MKNFAEYITRELNLPIYEDGYVQPIDCDNDTVMLHVLGSNFDGYCDYCKKLENEGFKKISSREVANNVFNTFVRDDRYVYAYFSRHYMSVRIVTGPIEMLGIEDCSSGLEEKYSPKLLTVGQTIEINCGQGYVFLLPDGRLLVQDSGCVFPDGRDFIYDAIMQIAPDPQNVVIAGWVISHPHGDHQDGFHQFAERHGGDENITVEKVIFNYIAARAYTFWRADGSGDNCEYMVHNLYEVCSKYLPNTQVVKAHTGQLFKFGSAEMEILYTIEDYFPSFGMIYSNSSSIVVRIVCGGQSFLLLADTAHDSGKILERLWRKHLKSDVVQVAHHGLWPSNLSLYEKCAESEIVLWPTQCIYARAIVVDKYADADTVFGILDLAKDVYVSDDENKIYDLPFVIQNNKEDVLEKIRNSH